jgi:hypothetical protein
MEGFMQDDPLPFMELEHYDEVDYSNEHEVQ